MKYFSEHLLSQSAWRLRALREAQHSWQSFPPADWQEKRSLRGLHLVPDFVVFSAARNVLPKIDSLHISIRIIEVQAFDFVRSKKLCRARIRGRVVRPVCHQLLRLGFNHVFEEGVRELFIAAGSGNH